MSDANTPAGHASDSDRRKLHIRRIAAGAIVLLFIGMLVVVNLDSVGHRWMQCQVVDANGQQGGQNSASAWEVVIDTQDCGRMVYAEGVNRDNVEEKAADFEPGRYEMKMGITSQWAANGVIPGVNPSFEEYRQTR